MMKIRDRVKAFKRVKTSELLPNPKNWRRHPPAQQDAMRGILAEIGFAGAVLARETPDGLQLIDGHLRAELSPDAKVPVLVLDVTEEEADKLLATYDPLAAMAEADGEALSRLLAEIETESEALGKMLEELGEGAGILAEPQVLVDPEPQIDRAAELQKEWGTERSQFWIIPSKSVPGKSHRVMCGDSTKAEDVGKLLGDVKPGLMVTDPPYGLGGYAGRSGKHDPVTGDDGDVRQFLASLPQCEHRYVWCEWRTYPVFLEILGEPRALIVWAKPWPGMGKGYRRQHEFCLYFGDFRATDEYDLWHCDYKSEGITSTWQRTVSASSHPTQKPVECMARAIRNHGHPNVYDPFLGSGTTMVAAEQLGRVCYGIEIEPKYVAVSLQRMADLGLKPELSKSATEPNPLQKQPRGKIKRKAATLTR